MASSLGSSPLARGLQRARMDARQGEGIIPARAGFTTPRRPGAWPRADHPRSRGVYRVAQRRSDAATGSSPLARGLQKEPGTARVEIRIIPARAGFTLPARARSLVALDHPRSRGVYSFKVRITTEWPGSSPLARGLRGRLVLEAAGAEDHPRSRGVYLDGEQVGVGDAGIIPARAGFTPTTVCAGRDTWDHPRSRGVYSDRPRMCFLNLGSSPLARGLPTRNRGRYQR